MTISGDVHRFGSRWGATQSWNGEYSYSICDLGRGYFNFYVLVDLYLPKNWAASRRSGGLHHLIYAS